MARKEPEAVRITSATRSHSDDIGQRQRRYLISMGVRTACFVVAVGCYLLGFPAWVMWIFLGASFVLPYVAVVMANAGASTDPDDGPDPFGPDLSLRALERPSEEPRDTPTGA